MKVLESSVARVWSNIALMLLLYIGAVFEVYRNCAASTSTFRLLALAASMALVPFALLTALGTSSILAKSTRYWRQKRAARISPEIRACLADALVGAADRKRLRWLARHHQATLENIFSEVLSSVEGEIKTQLGALATELGLVKRWRRAAYSRNLFQQRKALANLGRIGHEIDPALLTHRLEQTRIEAACAMLASGSTNAPALVFEMLPRQSLRGRILLAESLRPFAAEVCEKHLVAGIRSQDVGCARASLELLRAWERWIPIDNFSEMLAQFDPITRMEALAALRFVVPKEKDADQEILRLLGSDEESVRVAAAAAAADLGVRASLPLLFEQLRNDGPASALAAAKALARMGARGVELLEQEIFSGTRSGFALHALEQSLLADRG